MGRADVGDGIFYLGFAGIIVEISWGCTEWFSVLILSKPVD